MRVLVVSVLAVALAEAVLAEVLHAVQAPEALAAAVPAVPGPPEEFAGPLAEPVGRAKLGWAKLG